MFFGTRYAFLNFVEPRVAQDFAAQLEGSAWNEKSPNRLAITALGGPFSAVSTPILATK